MFANSPIPEKPAVKAEAEVYSQFQKMVQGKTSLLISHRLGSAHIADRIIVLHNGQVVEQGTHAELMSDHQYYAQMFEAQSEWYKEQVA